jgi:hypothetical protein
VALAVALAACAWLSACDRTREASCRFARELRVFDSASLALDDIALTGSGGAQLAVFSDEAGLHVRALGADGRPLAAEARIGERSPGGLAAITAPSGTWIACLRPGETREASAGHAVTLYRYERAHGATALARFGTAGHKSQGITLHAFGDGAWLGYQDAIVGEARTWLMSLQLTAATAVVRESRVLSQPGLRGGAPSFAVQGARAYAVWPEAHDAVARVMWSSLAHGAQPRVLYATHDPLPSPAVALASASTADFVVGFRDRRDKRRKTGLYLVPVDADGRPARAPRRIARADGTGRPALEACGAARGRAIVAATPRTFGGDYFVGAVSIDPALEHLSGEQQFYEDSREYSQVAASCAGDSTLLLIAERGKAGRSRAALRAVPFTCR